MALAFYVTDKADGKNGNQTVALAVRDTASSSVDIPAYFSQTQDLTSAFIGVTDYGMLVCNSQATSASSSITLYATLVQNRSSVVSKVTSLSSVLATAVGASIA